MEKQLTWKEKLAGKIPAELGREIDIFEQQMALRRQGKIDEKVFAETRLRRGIYGTSAAVPGRLPRPASWRRLRN